MLVLLATGCGQSGGTASSPVQVSPPHPQGDHADQCRRLVADLPARVAGQAARPVHPGSAFVAAWGDPAIVLRCGVPKPTALRPTSQCFEVNRVGWLATTNGHPASPTAPVTGPLTFVTIGRSTYVEITVPSQYQPAADALADVASAVRKATSWPHPCR